MGHARMPFRVKAFLIATVAVVVTAAYLLQPWADVVALVTIIAIAPFATVFALIYFWTTPWWETLIGRAMLASSTGLALLVDISLLYQWLGDNYAQRDIVRLAVFFTVLIGAVFKLAALALIKYRAQRAGRLS